MKKTTRKAAWIGGLIAAAGTLVGVTLWATKVKASSAQTPTWTRILPDGTGIVTLPENATFAISDVATDPGGYSIATQINAAIQQHALKSVTSYMRLPNGYPNDGLPAASPRVVGVVAAGSGGVQLQVTQTTQVFVFSGVKA